MRKPPSRGACRAHSERPRGVWRVARRSGLRQPMLTLSLRFCPSSAFSVHAASCRPLLRGTYPCERDVVDVGVKAWREDPVADEGRRGQEAARGHGWRLRCCEMRCRVGGVRCCGCSGTARLVALLPLLYPLHCLEKGLAMNCGQITAVNHGELNTPPKTSSWVKAQTPARGGTS